MATKNAQAQTHTMNKKSVCVCIYVVNLPIEMPWNISVKCKIDNYWSALGLLCALKM